MILLIAVAPFTPITACLLVNSNRRVIFSQQNAHRVGSTLENCYGYIYRHQNAEALNIEEKDQSPQDVYQGCVQKNVQVCHPLVQTSKPFNTDTSTSCKRKETGNCIYMESLYPYSLTVIFNLLLLISRKYLQYFSWPI
jgi:hypothetical protein